MSDRLAGNRRARSVAALGPFTPTAFSQGSRNGETTTQPPSDNTTCVFFKSPRQVSHFLRRDLTWASTEKAGKRRFLHFLFCVLPHHPRLLPPGGGAKRFPAESIALNTKPRPEPNMNSYFACPYNIDATGFYFHSLEEYLQRSVQCADSFGNLVEEFEIQFIDGGAADAQLFEALDVNQASLSRWFDCVDELSAEAKAAVFYLASQCGQTAEDALDNAKDVILREGEIADAAADQFDEIYSELPQGVRMYVDIEAYARDCRLNGDLDEFDFDGTTYSVLNANDF
ncbi:antirestriction protein ArdA [Paraburkholderia sediminicola]|uniref:antirestriction protein ArdA n=1 Tax=Paraburkholderia sediminicola TaxID=458836 RepID=UPI0038B7CCD6